MVKILTGNPKIPIIDQPKAMSIVREALTEGRHVPHFLISKISFPDGPLEKMYALTEQEKIDDVKIKEMIKELSKTYGSEIYPDLEEKSIYQALMISHT